MNKESLFLLLVQLFFCKPHILACWVEKVRGTKFPSGSKPPTLLPVPVLPSVSEEGIVVACSNVNGGNLSYIIAPSLLRKGSPEKRIEKGMN